VANDMICTIPNLVKRAAESHYPRQVLTTLIPVKYTTLVPSGIGLKVSTLLAQFPSEFTTYSDAAIPEVLNNEVSDLLQSVTPVR
jgi:hypothetical protein